MTEAEMPAMLGRVYKQIRALTFPPRPNAPKCEIGDFWIFSGHDWFKLGASHAELILEFTHQGGKKWWFNPVFCDQTFELQEP